MNWTSHRSRRGPRSPTEPAHPRWHGALPPPAAADPAQPGAPAGHRLRATGPRTPGSRPPAAAGPPGRPGHDPGRSAGREAPSAGRPAAATSARARARSARSTVAGSNDSSNRGARTRTSPAGPTSIELPQNALPPSVPTRLTYDRNTPCSSAMLADSRSQRATLAGPGTPSSRGQAPRAGAAEDRKMICAPSRAATVPVRLCHASSHTRSAARPHRVSNARRSWPRSTNRSSSNNPYVGRNILAVDVVYDRVGVSADRRVEHAVVQRALPALVEADHDIECSACRHRVGHRRAIHGVDVAGHRARPSRASSRVRRPRRSSRSARSRGDGGCRDAD